MCVREVAIALDGETGMCAALRRMRDEEGLIDHVAIGMNANAEVPLQLPRDS